MRNFLISLFVSLLLTSCSSPLEAQPVKHAMGEHQEWQKGWRYGENPAAIQLNPGETKGKWKFAASQAFDPDAKLLFEGRAVSPGRGSWGNAPKVQIFVSPDEKHAVILGKYVLVFFDMETGRPLEGRAPELDAYYVLAIEWSPDSKYAFFLVSYDEVRGFNVVDMEKRTLVAKGYLGGRGGHQQDTLDYERFWNFVGDLGWSDKLRFEVDEYSAYYQSCSPDEDDTICKRLNRDAKYLGRAKIEVSLDRSMSADDPPSIMDISSVSK